MTDDPVDVLTGVRDGVGRITLDRPRAMNALTRPMVGAVDAALHAWRDDPEVEVVLIDGSGERGLCAGGDIKSFHASALGDGTEARAFWVEEYAMNAHIDTYPKPVVALMFGAVLGGGVGISAHAEHRLVTEGSSVGMPEVGIGFVPDVGGTWLLGHAPGELGLYVALTGLPVGPGDALLCGLADAYVTPETMSAVRDAPQAAALLSIVRGGAGSPPPGVLAGRREWIDTCFAAPTAVDILSALRATGVAEAHETADLIETRSPEAVELTLLAVRRARTLSTLREALEMELALSTASLERPDFVEGIRAQVIDKDRNPRWQPASLSVLDAVEVARRFHRWVEPSPEGAANR